MSWRSESPFTVGFRAYVGFWFHCSPNPFYVAISRARLEARIYTDAIAGLPGSIAKRYDKTTALALQKERDAQRLQKAHAPKTVVDGPKTERALEREKRMRPNSPSGGIPN